MLLIGKEDEFQIEFHIESALPKRIKQLRFNDVSDEDVQVTLPSTENANTLDGK